MMTIFIIGLVVGFAGGGLTLFSAVWGGWRPSGLGEAGGAPVLGEGPFGGVTRWQEFMARTRHALERAREALDTAERLALIDNAIDSLRSVQAHAATPLQQEAAAALEEEVRAAWRQTRGEWHLLQARATLRRALGSLDAVSQRAALEEFAGERAKAQSCGASSSQLQIVDAEAQAIAASLDPPGFTLDRQQNASSHAAATATPPIEAMRD